MEEALIVRLTLLYSDGKLIQAKGSDAITLFEVK